MTSAIDCIIFDCDGVILQSNELKTTAFAEVIKDEPPELIDEFIDYHRQNGGVSRYKKFEYFYETIRRTPYSQNDIDQAIEQYGKIVRKGLIACDEIPGIIAFLKKLQSHYQIYVVSGGDQKELREVFKIRGINQYFDEIYGSPSTKDEILNELIGKKKQIKPKVFFGDAKVDFLMANQYGFKFVFVSGSSEWKNSSETLSCENSTTIRDFNDIDAIHNELPLP